MVKLKMRGKAEVKKRLEKAIKTQRIIRKLKPKIQNEEKDELQRAIKQTACIFVDSELETIIKELRWVLGKGGGAR